MTTSVPQERPAKPALLRGWRKKCPNCGEGDVLFKYLKVHDTCPECGEDLSAQRADDGPAYVTILITGHIIAPLMLYIYWHFRPDPLFMALGFCLAFIAVSMFLLPRFKGMFIAMQWAKRMYGFGKQATPANK